MLALAQNVHDNLIAHCNTAETILCASRTFGLVIESVVKCLLMTRLINHLHQMFPTKACLNYENEIPATVEAR